jgi:hypothetical protein
MISFCDDLLGDIEFEDRELLCEELFTDDEPSSGDADDAATTARF